MITKTLQSCRPKRFGENAVWVFGASTYGIAVRQVEGSVIGSHVPLRLCGKQVRVRLPCRM